LKPLADDGGNGKERRVAKAGKIECSWSGGAVSATS
jgi:hypothetical protein